MIGPSKPEHCSWFAKIVTPSALEQLVGSGTVGIPVSSYPRVPFSACAVMEKGLGSMGAVTGDLSGIGAGGQADPGPEYKAHIT